MSVVREKLYAHPVLVMYGHINVKNTYNYQW